MVQLYTKEGENLNTVKWNVHPRPQFRRDAIVNLNGEWTLTTHLTDAERKASKRKGHSGEECRSVETIQVPYPIESALSGVQKAYVPGTVFTYQKAFSLSDEFRKQRVLLHIDGVDQYAEVELNHTQINETPVCTAIDGPWTLDVTEWVSEENLLEITVRDDLHDRTVPYGKQTLKRGGMWYTPVSGIWQTVWLESVPENYITGLHIVPGLESAEITVCGAQGNGGAATDGEGIVPGNGGAATESEATAPEGEIVCEGKVYPLVNGKAVIRPENPEHWTPENPRLYAFTVKVGEDEVSSYFALRTLEIGEVGGVKRLLLNGKPYFFHGLLDQGWWPDGLWTPASPENYTFDIQTMKNLGFNMLRKHIKVEPEAFYYECDRLGMVVFQDMVNNGRYSFLRDTVLPTVGIQKLKNRGKSWNPAYKKAFEESVVSTVNRLFNHPCVAYWTIFNEGWGQGDADMMYDLVKSLDDTRFVDSTSGWFRSAKTDVESRHVYFKEFKMPTSNKPIVLSEFGGYVYKDLPHSFNQSGTYGYRFLKSAEAYNEALKTLYLNEIVPAVSKGLCAAVYTQVSDVEDETNGILTYDRKVVKADESVMREIAGELEKAIESVK